MPTLPFRAASPSPTGESRRTRLALAAGLVGIAAVLLAYAASPSVRHAVKHAVVGVRHAVSRVFKDHDRSAAVALRGQVLVGPRVTLHTLHGHRAVIVFWSATCARCSAQATAVAQFAREQNGRGRTVGVDLDGDRAAGERFVELHHWTFPNLLEGDGGLAKGYGIKDPGRELPVSFVLGANGDILSRLSGSQSASALRGAVLKAH